MEIFPIEHHPETGWDSPFPTIGDSARTLVLVFGAAVTFRDDPGPLQELTTALPGTLVAGCSNASEVECSVSRSMMGRSVSPLATLYRRLMM